WEQEDELFLGVRGGSGRAVQLWGGAMADVTGLGAQGGACRVCRLPGWDNSTDSRWSPRLAGRGAGISGWRCGCPSWAA
ncbi:hypothetical protein KZ835_32085, partial [Pseudomonas aeruginosa]|uniref:hypothetical protein n=1 Tax=Pseudomonas aeruginosa TaxID=287 RepID=UPI001CA58486